MMRNKKNKQLSNRGIFRVITHPTQANLPATIAVLASSGEAKLHFVGEGL
jgi:hypothetical protein